MIGYLEGEVLFKEEQKLLVKAGNGIGYEIFYNRTCGKDVKIFTSQIFKEKSVELYGFENLNEKLFFENLLKVNGVGPKSAFSLINTVGTEALKQAILLEDIKTIKTAPGIGPKAAKQMILDLKDKIDLNTEFSGPSESESNSSFFMEAISAFKELGFQENEIRPIIKEKLKTNTYSQAEDLIKSVLVQLNN